MPPLCKMMHEASKGRLPCCPLWTIWGTFMGTGTPHVYGPRENGHNGSLWASGVGLGAQAQTQHMVSFGVVWVKTEASWLPRAVG